MTGPGGGMEPLPRTEIRRWDGTTPSNRDPAARSDGPSRPPVASRRSQSTDWPTRSVPHTPRSSTRATPPRPHSPRPDQPPRTHASVHSAAVDGTHRLDPDDSFQAAEFDLVDVPRTTDGQRHRRGLSPRRVPRTRRRSARDVRRLWRRTRSVGAGSARAARRVVRADGSGRRCRSRPSPARRPPETRLGSLGYT